MGYCAKCGQEIAEEAICPNCGCETGLGIQEKNVKVKKQISAKKIILIVVIAVALVAAIIAGLFVWNHIRTEQVKEQLAGKRFSYVDYGLYSATYCYFKFDDDANCTYYYFYANVMDEGVEYQRQYEIKFEDGMTFLVCGIDTYEIQYDRYGEIEGLYNTSTKKLYE